MGTRVGKRIEVDLDDLKNAAPHVHRAYPPEGYVMERLTFMAHEPFDSRQLTMHPDDVMAPFEMTRFDLVRSTAYEGEGRRVDVYDIWKHGDVVVRKIHVGTRYRDRFGCYV